MLRARKDTRPASRPLVIGRGEEGAHGPTLRPQVLISVFKYKYRFLFTFGVLTLLSVILVAPMVPLYESTSQLLVRETSATRVSQNPDVDNGRGGSGEYASIQAQLLNSEAFHREAVLALIDRGVFPADPAADDEDFVEAARGVGRTALDWVRENVHGASSSAEDVSPEEQHLNDLVAFVGRQLTVANAPRSSVIALSFAHTDRELARTVLDVVVDVYQKREKALFPLTNVLAEAERELQESRAEYDSVRRDLDEFRERFAHRNVRAAQEEVAKTLLGVRARKDRSSLDLLRVDATLARLRAELEKTPARIDSEVEQKPNERHAWIVSQIDQLLLRRKAERSPGVRETIDDQLAHLRGLLETVPEFTAGATKTSANETHQELVDLIRDKEIERQSLGQDVEDAARRVPELEARITSLGRERVTGDELDAALSKAKRELDSRERLFDKVAQSKAWRDADVEPGVSVLQPPTLPIQATGRTRFKTLVLGMLVALAAAFFVTVGSGLIDGSVRTTDELEAMSGTAVVVPCRKLSDRQRKKLRDDRAEIVGQLDRIATQIPEGQRANEIGGNAVVVTSVRHGDGASFVADALSERLRKRVHDRVLLVDWRPGEPERTGASADDAVDPALARATRTPGIDLIVSEDLLRTYPNETTAGVIERLLTSIGPRYGTIVFDAGSVLDEGEALQLMNVAAMTVLVATANKSRRADVVEASNLIAGTRSSLIGAVLNRYRQLVPWRKDRRS